MSVRFECPNGHTLYAEETNAGKTYACPRCGESVRVPYLAVKSIENIAASKRFANPLARGWGTKGFLLGVISSLAFVGLLFVGYLVLRNPRHTVSTLSVSGADPEVLKRKLRKIGLAFLDFESQTRRLAPINPTQLSWRVHLLPYLDQGPLYEQFKLNEPWDSPHNLALSKFMPDCFDIPEASAGEGMTRFRTPTGENFVFGNSVVPKFQMITDGASNTILAVVVGIDKATIWTKPDDLPISPDSPVDSLGKLPEKFIAGVTGQAEPIFMTADVSPFEFYSLLTPTGGEVVDSRTLNSSFEATLKIKPDVSSQVGATWDPISQLLSRSPSNKILFERKKKLREVGNGLNCYESSFNVYPIRKNPDWFDAKNRPKLSWRVYLLQCMEYQPLFDQFKLDETWDSPHNLQLLGKMPDVYRDPADPVGSFKTRLVRLTGPLTPFQSSGPGPHRREFTDGLRSTLSLVSCGADRAVPWTKPEDIEFDEKNSVVCLGRQDSKVIVGLFADGSIASFDIKIPPEVFKCYITHQGKEVIGENPYLINDL